MIFKKLRLLRLLTTLIRNRHYYKIGLNLSFLCSFWRFTVLRSEIFATEKRNLFKNEKKLGVTDVNEYVGPTILFFLNTCATMC